MFTDDKDIERELSAALTVVPSADFEARVLRTVQQDLPSRRRVVAPVWLAAAAAVLIGVGAWVLSDSRSRPVPERSVQPPAVVAETLPPRAVEQPVKPVPRTSRETPLRPARVARPSATETARVLSPEIIVPAGQLALIRRLVGDANAGRPTLPQATADPAAEPAELVVPPLVVEPVAVTGVDPGGSPSQGPKGLR
jgi:hypothetical protein